MTGYARARSAWADFPDLSTLVRAIDLEHWDAALLALKQQWLDPRDYGAMLDGVTDDTVAMNAALTASALLHAPVYVRGTCTWSGTITVPDGADMVGAGISKTNPGTLFKALSASAKIKFGVAGTGSHGGISGNFVVDGNNVATQPLFIGRRVGVAFAPLSVKNAAYSSTGDSAILIQECQNSHFALVNAEDNAGPGLTFDLGCGGLTIHDLEVNNSGSAGTYMLVSTQSGAQVGGVYDVPTDIQIVQSQIERPASATLGLFLHAAGRDIILDGPATANATGISPFVHFKMTSDGSHISTRLRLRSGYYTDLSTGGTIFDIGDSCSLVLEGRNIVVGYKFMFKLASTAVVEDSGMLTPTGGGTELDPASAGTLDTNVRTRMRYPLQINRRATSDTAFDVVIDGETGGRLRGKGDGSIWFGNGTDFLYAVARLNANGSWTPINIAIGCQVGASFSGGGNGILALGNAATPPTSNPTGQVGGFVYIDPADNKLKFHGASGTVTPLANP